MKKNFKMLAALAVAVAATSCSNDDLMTGLENNGAQTKGAVGVNTFVPTITRGAALNSVDDLVASENGFDLISFYNNGTGTEDAPSYTQFMGTETDGIEFKHDGSAWDYADRGEIKFWQELEGTGATDMKFFAVSPTSSSEKWPSDASYSITADAQSITYNVPTNVSEQVDIMYAQKDLAEGDYTNTSDAYTNGVPLNFHHALSQIVFKAKIADKDDGYVTAHVNSITVKNVHGAGEFNMATASSIMQELAIIDQDGQLDDKRDNEAYDYNLWTTSGDATNAYEVSTLQNAASITWTEALELTVGEVGGDETALMLLPQQLTGLDLDAISGGNSANEEQFATLTDEGSYLMVNCRVEYNDNNGNTTAIVGSKDVAEGEEGYYANLYIPISTQWNPGYKYVYTLIFSADSGDPVKATVESVDEWNTYEEDVPETGEDDNTGDGEEEPVITYSGMYPSSPLAFTDGEENELYYQVLPEDLKSADFRGNNQAADGTVDNPYEIGSYKELLVLAFKTSHPHMSAQAVWQWGSQSQTIHYKQTDDIDLTSDEAKTALEALYGSANAWAPLGGFMCFMANYDGDGHSITVDIQTFVENETAYYEKEDGPELTWNEHTDCGLFGVVYGNEISNLTIKGNINVDVPTSRTETYKLGTLVANNGDEAKLYNCVSEATIIVNESGYPSPVKVGGIAGENGGTIEWCHTTANASINVTSGQTDTNVGGLVGDNVGSGSMTASYNLAEIQAQANYVGGLIGAMQPMTDSKQITMTACYNQGNVSGDATDGMGGMFGYLYVDGSTIQGSYNSGTLNNTATVEATNEEENPVEEDKMAPTGSIAGKVYYYGDTEHTFTALYGINLVSSNIELYGTVSNIIEEGQEEFDTSEFKLSSDMNSEVETLNNAISSSSYTYSAGTTAPELTKND